MEKGELELNKRIHIAWFNERLQEGGIARNMAFKNYLEKKNFTTINFFPSNSFQRVINIFRLTFLLINKKDCTILVHGNFFITNYLIQIFPLKFYVLLVSKLTKRVAKRNKLIIEINDLRYEQSLDVKTKKVTTLFVEAERKILYDLEDAFYIFASNNMREYAVRKYQLNKENTSTIINGGPLLKKIYSQRENYEKSKIQYVYAGTLNKGRQIEELLELFKKCNNANLLLLGESGEWLLDKKLPKNVRYLGAKSESEAHRIVSKCDIGLVPYNQEGFYYNLCYPTKASFYITAGIPFLSTNLSELMNTFEGKRSCIFRNIENWEETIKSLDKGKIYNLKVNVRGIKNEFTWSNVLKPLEKII